MTPAPFKVRTEEERGVFVVSVEGELDMNTATQLERELARPDTGSSPLLIDLSRCEFIDSTGIALIVRSWQELERDGRFALCGVSDQVKRVLDITGLESTIPTHPNREDALVQLRS